ncbi:hypothetical protein G5S52_03855 [Grimontia sp. S25]|uniref:Uncharacterized protein n=1 Tax=Grimontia sedimenti TaxID=2711294 RepID=A0A6M1R3H5_9GAMM|nr:hypothetical protein [Grimontia sedimenti]NGN96815.1 hypothetical protein [Grimontia sedimenti]
MLSVREVSGFGVVLSILLVLLPFEDDIEGLLISKASLSVEAQVSESSVKPKTQEETCSVRSSFLLSGCEKEHDEFSTPDTGNPELNAKFEKCKVSYQTTGKFQTHTECVDVYKKMAKFCLENPHLLSSYNVFSRYNTCQSLMMIESLSRMAMFQPEKFRNRDIDYDLRIVDKVNPFNGVKSPQQLKQRLTDIESEIQDSIERAKAGPSG